MEMGITSRFVKEIDRAIATGKLHEPFSAAKVKEAFEVMIVMPPFAEGTFNTFLSKHEKDKARDNKVKAYFKRDGAKGSGLYRRLRK